jgi:hypothetical protein
MNYFNPNSIGPNGILIFFILFYFLCFVTTIMLLRLVVAVARLRTPGKRIIPRTRGFYFASIVALAPVMLIALNTLGQLEFIDIVLVAIFELVALFYIQRRILE